ncbi:MAG: hypothetical protein KF796_08590 [Ramlibacter sp.]|nr:hypothetical protein [Ramlibacter sp.]
MTTTEFSRAATGVITTFGSTAHKIIDTYQTGGTRLHDAVEQRWKRALKETSPKLTSETRKNAAHAQQVFSGYYAKGLALTADGAKVAVDTLVGVALATTERATALAEAGLRKAA